MTYISWALYAEGASDVDYFEVLIPRLIEHLVAAADGPMVEVPERPVDIFGVNQRSFQRAAEQICDGVDAIELLFVHGDSGGRAVADSLFDRTRQLCEIVFRICNFDCRRCIPIVPKQETEAWCLADKGALRRALGLAEAYNFASLQKRPSTVERIGDPKSIAASVVREATGRNRGASPRFPYSAVAQYQDLGVLREVPSFNNFESAIRRALSTFEYISFPLE